MADMAVIRHRLAECCQWQHFSGHLPGASMRTAGYHSLAARNLSGWNGKGTKWRIKPVELFLNVVFEPHVAGGWVERPLFCECDRQFPECQFFNIGREPAMAADNGITQSLHGRTFTVLNPPVMGSLQPFSQPQQPEHELSLFGFFLFCFAPETTADFVKLVFFHTQKFARQQFVICIHIFSLFVVNINVLPAPSDLGWGTLRSEIVLSVSGIITLLTVCLAPFTIFYILAIYSSFRATSTSAGCCQWQHFLSRRSHQPHSSLHLSGIAEVCHD